MWWLVASAWACESPREEALVEARLAGGTDGVALIETALRDLPCADRVIAQGELQRWHHFAARMSADAGDLAAATDWMRRAEVIAPGLAIDPAIDLPRPKLADGVGTLVVHDPVLVDGVLVPIPAELVVPAGAHFVQGLDQAAPHHGQWVPLAVGERVDLGTPPMAGPVEPDSPVDTAPSSVAKALVVAGGAVAVLGGAGLVVSGNTAYYAGTHPAREGAYLTATNSLRFGGGVALGAGLALMGTSLAF